VTDSASRTAFDAPRADNVRSVHAALSEAFERAAAQHPSLIHESHYLIAGRRVKIRLVGRRLSRLLIRALSHLGAEPWSERPDLLIEAWDEEETGVLSPGSRTIREPGAPGSTSASEDGRYVVFEQARTMSVLDRSRQHIIGWVSAADELSQYELGRPWHSELLLWQRDRGLQPVHAGFIARNGAGILLGGPGGAGKSTTALSCMRQGWSYLADDYVALEKRPTGGFVGYGIYSSAHVEPDHLQRFPSLLPGAIPGRLAREDKSLLLLADVAGASLAGSAEVRLIALPRVANTAETAFRPATKVEALLRLAPSSLLLLPYAGLGHSGFQAIAALVEALPVYWLELGRDLDQLPRAVGELLEATQGA
jgi:hypothetical protein